MNAERRAAARTGSFAASLVLVWGSAHGQSAAPAIPLAPGVTFALAVHTPENERPAAGVSNVAQGDYELLVTVTSVDNGAVGEVTHVDAADENRKDIELAIKRRVLAADIADARLQILGFHTDDPETIDGATSLGPSLAVVRDLRTTGSATYSVRNFRTLATSAGTLTRVGSAPVPFAVLVNGRRVELPAIRVNGQLSYDGQVRPWEQYIFDHPQHPLTLRVSAGNVGASLEFEPVFTREIVRIDFPTEGRALEEALNKECKVEVPGIYFDFDRATLTSESSRALSAIADVLRRQPEWRVSIEGHTDNVGNDAYNLDLSARRAAAVKTALVSDFTVGAQRLTTAGFGLRRPVETNDTIAGRARNRRVELVRDCGR